MRVHLCVCVCLYVCKAFACVSMLYKLMSYSVLLTVAVQLVDSSQCIADICNLVAAAFLCLGIPLCILC